MTEFQTQNGTDASATATSGGSVTQSTEPTSLITEIAAFTVPNGGIYTAVAVGGTARIAGRVLTVGGPDALVGGVRVSAASDGFKFGDRTAAYATVTGSSTVEVVSSATDQQGSSAGSASSSSTAAESSATESASATESGGEDASSTGSAAESSSTTGGAAGGATARSKAAFTALGGLAVLLCVFA